MSGERTKVVRARVCSCSRILTLRVASLRAIAAALWCARAKTGGTWWASPAGVQAAPRPTGLEFTPE